MSKYKVNFIEEKQTSTGKLKADAELMDMEGNTIASVTLWADGWPNFKEIKPGTELQGDIVVKQNGKWTNKTLYPEKTNTLSAPRAPAWAGGKAAVAEKNKGIAIAQENKQEGIKISSTFRDATLIAIEFLHGTTYTPDEFKKKWLEVRNWLWKNFDTDDTKENAPF